MGKIIGIDLGTTNSVVAVMEGDKPTVIVNEEGNRTTPSVVGFGKDGERLVGSIAKRQAITNPEKTISSIKRYMGQKFDESGAEVKHSTYTVVRGDNGQPRVKIDDKLFSPPEISAMILQKLKREAERYLGAEVTEAVVASGWLPPQRLEVEVVPGGGRVTVVVRFDAPTNGPIVGALVGDFALDAEATMRLER